MLLDAINNIALNVENEIKGLKGDSFISQFPEISLRELKGLSEFSYSDVVTMLLNNKLSKQWSPHHNFGDSRVTVYYGERFVIELNMWQKTFTSVHEHAFCGAFRIISGSGMHAKYNWLKTKDIAKNSELGNLELYEFRELNTNNCEPIYFGDGLIHNLTHLENPTFTLIIRNCRSDDQKNNEQREFFGNKLAISSFFYTDRLHCAKETIKLILNLPGETNTINITQVLTTLNDQECLGLVNKLIFNYPDLFTDVNIQNYFQTRFSSDDIKQFFDAIHNERSKSNNYLTLRSKNLSVNTNKRLAILQLATDKSSLCQMYSSIFGAYDFKIIVEELISSVNCELNFFPRQVESELCQTVILISQGVVTSNSKEIKSLFENSLFNPLVN